MLMGPGGPIIVLFAIVMATAIIITWIRSSRPAPRRDASRSGLAAHGDEISAERQIELLSTENAGLKGKVSRLEERLAVLERIVTDPAERTARDIESLR